MNLYTYTWRTDLVNIPVPDASRWRFARHQVGKVLAEKLDDGVWYQVKLDRDSYLQSSPLGPMLFNELVVSFQPIEVVCLASPKMLAPADLPDVKLILTAAQELWRRIRASFAWKEFSRD